jgi:hypothetical protein
MAYTESVYAALSFGALARLARSRSHASDHTDLNVRRRCVMSRVLVRRWSHDAAG